MMPLYLRDTFFYFACMIGLVVFAILIYALITFKRNDYQVGNDQEPNLKVELLWTMIPFIMIVFMALPVIKSFYQKTPVAEPAKVLRNK